MVFGWNIKQVVKKKFFTNPKDKKDWIDFTSNMGDISTKETDLLKENIQVSKVKKLDLHGLSLIDANKTVKEFITKHYNGGFKKILIITGKGLRSKTYDNPYVSKKLSVLKFSIPEFIQNDESLKHKVIRISDANLEDGGEGAIYVFLKNKKNL